MRTTTLKCDRCGESWDSASKDPKTGERQLWPVAVVLGGCGGGPVTGYGSGNISHVHAQQDWCRPCVDAMGMLAGYSPPKAPDAPAPPTLEELIGVIATEAALEVVRNQ